MHLLYLKHVKPGEGHVLKSDPANQSKGRHFADIFAIAASTQQHRQK